jgi:predicted O-linked N-acetylglucosamine transferase (SPINDLY family)
MMTLQDARARADAGDLAGADAAYRALHEAAPGDPNVLIAWSRLRQRVGDRQNAYAMLQRAVATGRQGAPALLDMAGMLLDQGQIEPAGQVLAQATRAMGGLAVDFQVARYEAARGNHEKAAGLFRGVMKGEPRHIDARFGLARSLNALGRRDEARGAYEALLKRAPGHTAAAFELAYLHGAERRFDAALAIYEGLEARGVDAAREMSQVALGYMHMGDWRHREALRARLAARVARPEPCITEPFAFLGAEDDPGVHRNMAARFVGAVERATGGRAKPAARGVGPAERRLRVGYLSGDFCQHATTLLLAGVIEAHDRGRFEVFGYDYSPRDGSASRERIGAAFEHFVSVHELGPVEAAARIAADEIDILVDLKGYTEHTRTEIMPLRPAPVQAHFLGYPGTLGSDWIDYVIADATVLPEAELVHYAEQPVYLPGSCYPSDRTRPLPMGAADRAAHGLPEDGVVLACFCNPFKIAPDVFGAWMGLLREEPAAVLWLLENNPFIAGNLKAAAGRAGIDPGRLVFAPAVALDVHLARHGCADLFLDTAPYGAHTTGVDALWAGLPMVTLARRSWASRAGASLLRAVGLDELVTESLESYSALALALMRDPARLAALRERLAEARESASLFDAPRFARGLEAAFMEMAARARAGQGASPIYVNQLEQDAA